MQQYTKEEVMKHCTRESCWVYIGDDVFDLTEYLHRHPPGATMILNLAQKGVDAKGMFSIHSAKAKQLWQSFKIGTIAN